MRTQVTARKINGLGILLAIMACSAVFACNGSITTEGDTGNPPASADAGRELAKDAAAQGEHVDITGPPVQPHVQAFVDAACAAVGSCEALTYEGHDPSADLAVDLVVSDTLGQLPSDNNALGDALADYALQHQGDNDIRYLIWRQRINFGGEWQGMEDRGSITQNHYDHVHVSFNESP